MKFVPCPFQRGNGLRKRFGSNEQVIRVKGGNGEQTEPGFGERRRERGEHPNLRQHERPVDLKDAPAGLGLHANGNPREFTYNRELIASTRHGEEASAGSPIGDRRISGETRNREAFRKQAEFETARRGSHRELEEAPNQAAIDRNGSAGDVARALGSEERDDGGEFRRGAEAPRGDFAFPTGKNLLRFAARAG